MQYNFSNLTVVNADLLHKELKQAFSNAFAYINVLNDKDVEAYFTRNLDETEQATLEDIIQNHDGIELEPYRLNLLLPSDLLYNPHRIPVDVNYNTDLVLGLSTYNIDFVGLRVGAVYEQTVDLAGNVLETPEKVVFERYVYTWDNVTKLPTSRLKKLYFYRTDGSLTECAKVLYKDLRNSTDRETITLARRDTIITWLVARSKELGLNNVLSNYFNAYVDQQTKFIGYGDPTIIDTITNDTTNSGWLDLPTGTSLGTVRQAVITSLSMALEPTEDSVIEGYLNSIGFDVP